MSDIGKPIEPFRFWCQHVIPLVYDDSLSYYEVLCKIKVTLNQLVEGFNNIPELIKTEIEKLVAQIEAEIAQLKKYVDAQDNYVLAASKSYTDSEIDTVKNIIDKNYIDIIKNITDIAENIQLQIDSIQVALQNLKLYTDSKIIESNMRTDALIQELRDEINNLKFKLPDIYNPVTGEYSSIQQTIIDLYDALRYEAFNCYEFDNSGITCKEFDDSKITAAEFDLKGRTILKKIIQKICECELIDPFTGKINSIQVIINKIVSFFTTTAITANEFDIKQLTAAEYDSKNISAYDFDFNGKTILV